MPKDLTLRQETPADAEAVFQLHQFAFGQDSEARLVDALRNNPAVFIPELSLVAVAGAEIVGHILFTRIRIRNRSGFAAESLALAPVAVRPALQRNGLGGQLINKGLATAKELGFASVIVLGHEQYYPKFGFAPASHWGITPPFDVTAACFMALELKPASLANASGVVIYPPEFAV